MKQFWDKMGHWINLVAICSGIVAILWMIKSNEDQTEAIKEFQDFQKSQIELNGGYNVVMKIVLEDATD
jgi:hypothetical protein